MTGSKKVLALGFFDGLHLGHAALLKRTNEVAKELGATPAILTFDKHPGDLIFGYTIPLINSKSDRAYLAEKYFGIRDIIFMRFDEKFMHTPWEAFIYNTLQKDNGAVHVVCGHDFHFGYKGEGNPQRLKRKCAELGIGCDVITKVEYDGITISSTYIRKLIAQGEIERANAFLGHPHTLSARVVRGFRLGRSIGFPTVNMRFEDGVLTPFHGVYATKVHLPGGEVRMGVTNVGTRPTVSDGMQVSVETNILDFDGDLYGATLRVDFYKLLRPEIKFSDIGSLSGQIARDSAAVRDYFG
ncbi:MAG: riboflavin biosynthesis protein RibF [Oscillospiraceae bacterium]|jgi:riboflavin kinase/FMN adenylyltransferase